MPFPTTSILDDFNTGANQNLTARAGWSAGQIFSFNQTLVTDVVPVVAQGNTGSNDNLWGTSFPGDQEVWISFGSTALPVGAQADLYARITNPGGTTPNAYSLVCTNTTAKIIKVIAGASTTIGSVITQSFSAGDAIGLQCIGTTIRSFYKASGGSWVVLDTVTDSSVTGPGQIGLDVYWNPTLFDWFAGGAVLRSLPTLGVGA